VEEPVDRVRTVDLRVYPNPFNSSCEITVPENADVEIYDLRGNLIATPYLDGEPSSFVPLDKGDSEIAKQSSRGFVWAPDENIPSGIYLVRATIPQQKKTVVCTKRIVYLK
ncbi:T9SS type A sorting domain-containing protein, partial [bacterium]|nr:T9SS type A sorting domain-containing protein [bacterium]